MGRTGAPRSHQRTWAENDMFRMLFLDLPWICRSTWQELWWGLPPSFWAHVRWCEHGAPVPLRTSHSGGERRGKSYGGASPRLFRPTYAGANMGHPFHSVRLISLEERRVVRKQLRWRFQEFLQVLDTKSIAGGGLRPSFLRLDPAFCARIQKIEGEHAAAQHLVMESPYVEFRTEVFARPFAQFDELELT